MYKPLTYQLPSASVREGAAEGDAFSVFLFADPSEVAGREHERRDILKLRNVENRLGALYDFVMMGLQDRPTTTAEDFHVIADRAFAAPLLATPWPGLDITYFMAGAYARHHKGETLLACRPETIASWYFLTFATHLKTDRVVTPRQKRHLAGPSEYDDLPLIVRLLWLNNADLQRRADLHDGMTRRRMAAWFAADGKATCDVHYLGEVGGDPVAEDDIREDEQPPVLSTRHLGFDRLVFFGANGNAATYCLPDTWNAPERLFRWTRGRCGLFVFAASETRHPVRLDVDLFLHRPGPEGRNHVAITCNGRTVLEDAAMDEGSQSVAVTLDRPLRSGHDLNVLAFHADPYVPSDDGSDDRRSLGVSISRLWIRRDV